MHDQRRRGPARTGPPVATDGGEIVRDGESNLPDSIVEDLRESRRRCITLDRLDETDEAQPVADLAREIAAAERDVDPDSVDAEAVDAVRRDLYQQHLPKLTATGVVRYDSLVGTLELATTDERLFGDFEPESDQV